MKELLVKSKSCCFGRVCGDSRLAGSSEVSTLQPEEKKKVLVLFVY